jgi:hypothetical protein
MLNLICLSGLWQVMNDLEELLFPITSGNRSNSGYVSSFPILFISPRVFTAADAVA